jgi:pimeloyl-ACP methyl ester carboxylesterase
MHYEEHGRPDGEPLLLLHGFTGTGQAWRRPFLNRLGAQYRLIVPDMRGHGRTTNPQGKIVHAELARDTGALVAALGIGRAHFCGHSSGAMHLLFLALEQPQLVHSLTLAAATYTFDEYVKARVREARASAPPQWIEELEARHSETHGAGYAYTLLDHWVDAVHRPGELPFAPADLGQIACPTSIVHGDRDQFFPVHVPVAMYEAIPDAQLCILPNCHHAVLGETLALFASVLFPFLERHPLAG